MCRNGPFTTVRVLGSLPLAFPCTLPAPTTRWPPPAPSPPPLPRARRCPCASGGSWEYSLYLSPFASVLCSGILWALGKFYAYVPDKNEVSSFHPWAPFQEFPPCPVLSQLITLLSYLQTLMWGKCFIKDSYRSQGLAFHTKWRMTFVMRALFAGKLCPELAERWVEAYICVSFLLVIVSGALDRLD